MLAAGRSIKFFSERFYHGAAGMILAALLAITFPLAYEKCSAAAALTQVCILYGIAAAV
ncbi:UBA1, partial [Symbiodinium pilosum]